MGNRAIVIFYEEGVRLDETKYVSTSPAIYLHWNGGPESVYAFLKEMDRREIRVGDTSYEAARFIQLIGDWMDADERGTLSLGTFNGPTEIIDPDGTGENLQTVPSISAEALMPFDHGDNGIYLVNRSEGTVSQQGAYGGDFEGTLEEAYASVAANAYTAGFAKTFLEIDEKLYGVSVEA